MKEFIIEFSGILMNGKRTSIKRESFSAKSENQKEKQIKRLTELHSEKQELIILYIYEFKEKRQIKF